MFEIYCICVDHSVSLKSINDSLYSENMVNYDVQQ